MLYLLKKSQESEYLLKTINIKHSLESDFTKHLKTSNESEYCKFQKYIKQNDEIIID
jgi:hypothetical protein